jgi:hypothetical protein
MIRKLEAEIKQLCKETYTHTHYFLKVAKSCESRVFYSKVMADQFRYLRQFEDGAHA